jgi:hypothetical protein
MHRLIFTVAAALVLSIGAASKQATAQTAGAASESAPATATTGSVHKTAVVCGPNGCRHYWPRHHVGMAPPPPIYPPACPTDYHYECKQGPLGYGQCGCWPYGMGWAW